MAIGASITSGGTGKNEDSANDSNARYHGACGWRDQRMVRANSEEKIFIDENGLAG